jgi:hypothetical protein
MTVVLAGPEQPTHQASDGDGVNIGRIASRVVV